MGKMAIAVSRSNPERVYALIESDSNEGRTGGLFVSNNGGKSWAKASRATADCAAGVVLHRAFY